MASFTLNSFSTTQRTLSTGEFAYITENGYLILESTTAIIAGSTTEIYNDGSIFGGANGISFGGANNYISNTGIIRGTTVALDFNVVSVPTDTTIYNSGLIEAVSGFGDAILSQAGGLYIVNSGIIRSSGDDAIQLRDNGFANIENEIINSGTIETTMDGGGLALNLDVDNDTVRNSGTIKGGIFLSDGTNVLENHGLIQASETLLPDEAYDVRFGDDFDTVLNTGTIVGDIDLGLGVDVFMGQDGYVYGVVSGGGGADEIHTGLGDDLLRGGIAGDFLYGDEGIDTALYDDSTGGVLVNLMIGRGRRSDADGDRLYDIENVVGSNHADTLYGDGGANMLDGGTNADYLSGRAGDDILIGGGGADSLYGGADMDILIGGNGRDRLTGDGGADLFVFERASDSGVTSSTRDIIRDFEQGEDQIDLSEMGATVLGGSSFTNTPGEVIHYLVFSNARTVIEVDVDGDGSADMAVLIANAGLAMTEDDFLLG